MKRTRRKKVASMKSGREEAMHEGGGRQCGVKTRRKKDQK